MDSQALEVLDSEPLQRLRYIKQLGHAFLVYPTANHTRFEHAVGTYHLARRALSLLDERGELDNVDAEERALIPLAGLVHDVGHYPFSHSLEEAGLPSHEELAMTHFAHPSLRSALRHTGFEDIESRLQALITGRSQTPLQGLISGSLDLDKLEYLSRDARMCGVPYGAVDVDRLLHAITVLDSDGGPRRVGIREKGISALESLLFARYQMYRNVYWHHAVRSATAMFKRAVRTALAHGELTVDAVAHSTDEGLMQRLRETHGNEIALRLRQRKLYKRLVDIAGEEVPEDAGDWVAECPDLVERVENKLAAKLQLQPGEVLLDFPAKAKMIEVDMPLLRKDGTVEPLAASDGTSQLGIHRIADELHARARRLRVFAATSRPLDQQYILQLVERKKNEVESDLESDML
ncbi:MAG: HD domain-containing protein [Gemmatimonadetes bacterium]|nr:HD domain-containing protein [Gemmatimonadota bacterium]